MPSSIRAAGSPSTVSCCVPGKACAYAARAVKTAYYLAKLLYELRFDFTARLLSDPDSLGHYIHAESGRSVKRLQE